VLLITALVITISLIYSTFKLGISPMPSSRKANNAMVDLLELTDTGPIIDLGSGWGNFVIRVATINPDRKVIGYEASLLPWLVSTLLKRILRLDNLTIYKENFFNADLSGASVLICYLYPQAMERIQNKLRIEQSNVGFLISNNFALPSQKPDKIIQIDDFYQSPIYLYKMAKKSCR
jgi:hypothetical protein